MDGAALNFLHIKLDCPLIHMRTSETSTRSVRYHIVSNEDPLSGVAAGEHTGYSGGSKRH